jgi:hypothetical protein
MNESEPSGFIQRYICIRYALRRSLMFDGASPLLVVQLSHG